MKQRIARTLAEIHSKFGIFDIPMLNADKSRNIIDQISGIPSLAYLHQFYIDYKEALTTEFGKSPCEVVISRRTDVSRSVDLPFIGESVVQTGHAKCFFVFEGSLAQKEFLSVTVLACLWPLEATPGPLHGIVRKFWPSPYDYIVECLGIKSEIAKHSYVVDAVRIAVQGGKKPDRKQNRLLLEQEINLLKPRLLVLVGRIAEETIGNKAREAERGRYFAVPFPTRTRSPEDVQKAKPIYEELKAQIPGNSESVRGNKRLGSLLPAGAPHNFPQLLQPTLSRRGCRADSANARQAAAADASAMSRR